MAGFFVFSGTKLLELRTSKGLSREELAVAAGSSYPAIATYETNQRSPSRPALLRLAAALGVRPRDLVDDDPAFAEVP